MKLSVCYVADDFLVANSLITILQARGHQVLDPRTTLINRALDLALRESIVGSEATILIYSRVCQETLLGYEVVKAIVAHRDRQPESVVIFSVDDAPVPASLQQSSYIPYNPDFAKQVEQLCNLLPYPPDGATRSISIEPATDIAPLPWRSSGSSNYDRIVLLVHGINTHAHWIDKIDPVLRDAGFMVVPASYGQYSVLKFLSRSSEHQTRAIQRILLAREAGVRRMSRERNVYKPRVSIIAHSFGTFLSAEILHDHPSLEWERIIFCGGVIREDYRFDRVAHLFERPLINEVGAKDYWPIFAQAARVWFGSVGSTGIHSAYVTTRWHKGHSHSSFLVPTFCRDNWIPFLTRGEVKDFSDPVDLPLWVTLLSFVIRWRWWFLGTVALAIAVLIFLLKWLWA